MTLKRPWLFISDIPGVPRIRRLAVDPSQPTPAEKSAAVNEAQRLIDYMVASTECQICQEWLARPDVREWSTNVLLGTDRPYQLLDYYWDVHQEHLGQEIPTPAAGRLLRSILSVLSIPALIVSLPASLVMAIMMAIPILGIVPVLLLTVTWLPFVGFILATSWLWERAGVLRPFITIVGFPVVFLAGLSLLLLRDPEQEGQATKLALVCTWPASLSVFRHTRSQGHVSERGEGSNEVPLEDIERGQLSGTLPPEFRH